MAKKNAPDTTLRNLRAAKKREKALQAMVEKRIIRLETLLVGLNERVMKLEGLGLITGGL